MATLLSLGTFGSSLGQRRGWVVGLLLLLLLGGTVLLATGFGQRVWNALKRRIDGPAALTTERVRDDGTYRNLIFLHHSVGDALIVEGRVRERLSEKGYQLWDHGYNWDGIRRPDGKSTHTHYGIPETSPDADSGGNTDPDGLAVLFGQPVHDPPDNAFSRLLQHPVVIFKSCYPNSGIKSDAMLESRKALYLSMRNAMDQHPKHAFILLTTPPLHPQVTRPEDAARARALARWLTSEEFRGGHPNVFVFDFFDLLADPATHMLKEEYRLKTTNGDSHPNSRANKAIGPVFADYVDRTVRAFRERVRP